jgi:hypothetical protein
MERFNTAEPMPKNRAGIPFLTILYGRAESRLLIAQYLLNFDDPKVPETCHQQYFVLDGGKFRSISPILPRCTQGLDK